MDLADTMAGIAESFALLGSDADGYMPVSEARIILCEMVRTAPPAPLTLFLPLHRHLHRHCLRPFGMRRRRRRRSRRRRG